MAETTWVDRTEVRNMAACSYRAALVDPFWVTFLVTSTSYLVDLSQDLFLVLRIAGWKWYRGWRWLEMARQWRQT